MTNERSTPHANESNSADARRRQIRVMQLLFAGAAAVATLALFSAAGPSDTDANTASGPAPLTAPIGMQLAQNTSGAASAINVDDDTNPSSGDIFTQNAQDQSTA